MRVVVAGGGIGGLELIRNLKGFEVTLIERRERMVCQALLPEYVVGKVDDHDVSVSLEDFCDEHGVNWIKDRVLKVEDGRVFTEKGEVEYDYLVLAVGSRPYVFENTQSLFDLESAKECRKAVEGGDRVVVIGSGATGVEVALELREIGKDVTIVEYLNRVLPSFDERVSSFVYRILKREGVNVLTSCKVLSVEDVVKTSLGELDYDVAISCAGVIPNSLNLKRDRGGIVVDNFLRVDDRTFAIGDCASVKGATKTAYEAEMQARCVARNLVRIRRGDRLIEYRVRSSLDKPIAMITLGRGRAVMVYKGLFLPRPMKLIYLAKKAFLKGFMGRYRR